MISGGEECQRSIFQRSPVFILSPGRRSNLPTCRKELRILDCLFQSEVLAYGNKVNETGSALWGGPVVCFLLGFFFFSSTNCGNVDVIKCNHFKVYSSLVLSTFRVVKPSRSSRTSSPQQEALQPLSSHLSPPQPRQPLVCLLPGFAYSVYFIEMEFYIMWAFVWLLSLSRCFRFIQVIACIST